MPNDPTPEEIASLARIHHAASLESVVDQYGTSREERLALADYLSTQAHSESDILYQQIEQLHVALLKWHKAVDRLWMAVILLTGTSVGALMALITVL